jgi:phosphate transport system protein
MSDHTFKPFDQELEALGRRVAEMGGVAEKMLADAMDGLFTFDVDMARRAVASGLLLDTLRRGIEGSAIVTIAREQPVSVDLRECIAALRVASDLVRIGDRTRDIADRAVTIIGEAQSSRAFIGLKSMREVAEKQLKDVLDAYAQRDVVRARAVWFDDADLDALEDSVLRDLLTFMMEDPRNITFCAHLLFCSKNLERIGDHTTNIAETVVWMVSGERMPIERPKTRIASLSIDADRER